MVMGSGYSNSTVKGTCILTEVASILSKSSSSSSSPPTERKQSNKNKSSTRMGEEIETYKQGEVQVCE